MSELHLKDLSSDIIGIMKFYSMYSQVYHRYYTRLSWSIVYYTVY